MSKELGREYPPAGEDALIETIAAITTQVAKAVAGRVPLKRAAHPKAHGCVDAIFRVEQDLAQDFRVGVFQPGKEYKAKVRFSNGNLQEQHDKEPDIRGMAIKLLLGEGKDQDFLLISSNVFFSRDANDYLAFTVALTDQSDPSRTMDEREARYFHGRPERIKKNYRDMQVLMMNPLNHQYFSPVPFKMGDNVAVKYSARPRSEAPDIPPDASPDFLRKAMSAHLQQSEARFDFLVQKQVDPEAMPVEDPTVAWDEKLSPFVKVGTITIAQQAVGDCEDLSFDPWHALAEHAPLGGINRIRKKVYEQASAARHSH